MRKTRLIYITLILFAIAIFSAPIFGDSVSVSLSCAVGTCGGSTTPGGSAIMYFKYISLGSFGVSLPVGSVAQATIQTAAATSVENFIESSANFPTDSSATEATYAAGGLMTVLLNGAPLLSATFTSAQSEFICCSPYDTYPHDIDTFDGQFDVTYWNPDFFSGSNGCSSPNVCGSGSVHLFQNTTDDGTATLTATGATTAPEPSPLALMLLGASFVALVSRRRLRAIARPSKV